MVETTAFVKSWFSLSAIVVVNFFIVGEWPQFPKCAIFLDGEKVPFTFSIGM